MVIPTRRLPYAEAGFVVIQYSIDGAVDSERGEPPMSDMIKAYEQLKASGAGVVNGRNALSMQSVNSNL